ncbi:MAG TPA: hypothetical protein VIK93_08635 [Limnochordales bacterium]
MRRSGRRWLRLLAWATLLSAGTGVLLSVPPVSLLIYPVYPHVHRLHGWISLAVAVPFAAAAIGHGIPAWRARGLGESTRSGFALSVAYPLALASGLYNMRLTETAPWVMVVHFASGIAALVAAYVHGQRPGPAAKRDGGGSGPIQVGGTRVNMEKPEAHEGSPAQPESRARRRNGTRASR